MNHQEFTKFVDGAKPVTTRPKRAFAKRVVSAKCLNPNAKITYSYERVWELTLEDGTSRTFSQDCGRGPDRLLKAGSWVVVIPPKTTEPIPPGKESFAEHALRNAEVYLYSAEAMAELYGET